MLSQTSSTLRTREAGCQQLDSDLRAIQSLYSGLEAKMEHRIQEANQTTQELRVELQEQRDLLDRAQRTDTEKSIRLRCLEDENSQLKADVHDVKKEWHQKSARLRKLRAQQCYCVSVADSSSRPVYHHNY